jgi:MFS family permease
LVLIAVSLMFFFISAATFQSLGVVLFTMAKELRWTQTEAGASFSVLGLTCCLSSLAPMAMVNRIGSRWTMLIGGLMLAAGFLLAFDAHALPIFLLATGLMGVGFSLAANIPGVYLLARWFPNRSGRVIGAYLMCGAFGGVAGPPLAQLVIAAGGWRFLWLVLAWVAVAIGLLCLLLIRDRGSPAVSEESSSPSPSEAVEWRLGDALRTPQFIAVGLGMVITEACVTVVNSAGVSHFSRLGLTPLFAAGMLSLQALTATVGKGVSGALGDWISPRLLLVGGLVLESVGMVLLGFASSQPIAYAFAILFGLGWGVAYLSITVILINDFGPRTGSAALSIVWLATALSSLGPAGAGMVADRWGSFSPAFEVGGGLLLPIAIAVLMLRPPVRKRAPQRLDPSGAPYVIDTAA